MSGHVDSHEGRVYDSNVGRFLSVDPVVSSANSQSLNPYSYLENNPLVGTDPTGLVADTRSICFRSPGACGKISGTDAASALKAMSASLMNASGAGQSHDRQSAIGPTSQPDSRQDADIRDGSRKNTQLVQTAEPESEAERDAETRDGRAEAARARGISPATLPFAEGNAARRLEEAKRMMRLSDPDYEVPRTWSDLGENSPIDQLAQVESELAARQAKFMEEVLPREPTGSLRNPMNVPGPQNAPTTVGARQYTGHALDQMQGRGIVPSVVEDTLVRRVRTPGRDGATIFTTEQARVIVNPDGSIKTVYGQ